MSLGSIDRVPQGAMGRLEVCDFCVSSSILIAFRCLMMVLDSFTTTEFLSEFRIYVVLILSWQIRSKGSIILVCWFCEGRYFL